MDREQIIRRNDLLRTELKGGRVVFSRSAMELDANLRGRLIWRISQVTSFVDDCEHDEGLVIFAGYTVVWTIREFAGELVMDISILEG